MNVDGDAPAESPVRPEHVLLSWRRIGPPAGWRWSWTGAAAGSDAGAAASGDKGTAAGGDAGAAAVSDADVDDFDGAADDDNTEADAEASRSATRRSFMRDEEVKLPAAGPFTISV